MNLLIYAILESDFEFCLSSCIQFAVIKKDRKNFSIIIFIIFTVFFLYICNIICINGNVSVSHELGLVCVCVHSLAAVALFSFSFSLLFITIHTPSLKFFTHALYFTYFI